MGDDGTTIGGTAGIGGGGDVFLLGLARRVRNEGNDSRRKRSLRVSGASLS